MRAALHRMGSLCKPGTARRTPVPHLATPASPPGGELILTVFEKRLPDSIEKQPFKKILEVGAMQGACGGSTSAARVCRQPGGCRATAQLRQLWIAAACCRGSAPQLPLTWHSLVHPCRSPQVAYVKRVIEEADGIQPHLVAPEAGYRRMLEEALGYLKDPCEKSVEEVGAWVQLKLRRWGAVSWWLQRAAVMASGKAGRDEEEEEEEEEEAPQSTVPCHSAAGVCAAAPHGGQHCEFRRRARAAAVPHAAPRDCHRSIPQPGGLQGGWVAERAGGKVRMVVAGCLGGGKAGGPQLRCLALLSALTSLAPPSCSPLASHAATPSLLQEDTRKMVNIMVEMERNYITAEYFRSLQV